MKSHAQLAESNNWTVSFYGFEFDMNADHWDLRKGCRLNVRFIKKFDESIQADVRKTMVYFAEHKSWGHISNVRREIAYYVKNGYRTISEEGLLAFKSQFLNKDKEYRVGVLRVFLKQLFFLGYSAVSESIFEFINSWRLSGNEKGKAVLSLDPETGPFSDIEFHAIRDGLDYCYGKGELNEEDYSMAQLFAATGRRPVQIAHLKIADLRVDTVLLKVPTYILNIPKAKIRGGKFRSKFKDVALIESIGQVLTIHIEQVVKNVEKLLGRELSNQEKNEVPLFPDGIHSLKVVAKKDFLNILKTELFHLKSRDLVCKLVQIIKSLNIVSERTGRPLKVNGYRFRYTQGTRSAREGAGVLTIANLLDQSDTQNTSVYVANIPEHAAEISRIMNGSLIQYADAFKGKVVNPSKKQEPESKGIVIRTYENTNSLGQCGTSARCHDHAPIACYTCPKFKAWSDAPHEKVLEELQKERSRIAKETNDLEIAEINDRSIFAVVQVIRKCHLMKGSSNG